MAERLTLYFDGGCRPNPGPIEIMVVVCGQAHYRAGLGTGDSNDAEWLALLYAAELAAAAGAADVLFIGDSSLVVEQAAGRQRCRGARLQAHQVAFETTVAGIARVRLKWVPRTKNLAGIALARWGLPAPSRTARADLIEGQPASTTG